jgi:putative transposase
VTIIIEIFNSWVRQECLNQHWFLSFADAVTKIEAWNYNSYRPHRSLGYLTPRECGALRPENTYDPQKNRIL